MLPGIMQFARRENKQENKWENWDDNFRFVIFRILPASRQRHRLMPPAGRCLLSENRIRFDCSTSRPRRLGSIGNGNVDRHIQALRLCPTGMYLRTRAYHIALVERNIFSDSSKSL